MTRAPCPPGPGGHPHMHSDTPLIEKRNLNQVNETTTDDGVAPSSNNWPDPISPLPQDEAIPRVVEFTAENERHMREDLHRDPAELLARQQANLGRQHAHEEALQRAAPGRNLTDMATGEHAGEPVPRPPPEGSAPTEEDKFKHVRVRNLSSDEREPTSKATRGYV